MAEIEKIELSNEEDTLEEIALAFVSPMVTERFRAEVGRILENSEKYQGIFTLSDDPASTNKLFEKLQERCDRYEKALTEIYLDENETIIDPVFLFHQSQRIAERALKELGENNEI